MPFRKNLVLPPIFQEVITPHVVTDYDENGNLVTKIDYVNECAKDSVDYQEYSLRNQLASGDTVKHVRTDLLGDDFDSITTDMVKPYFDNEETSEN